MKKILILSPFCKSATINKLHGMEKYFHDLFNVLNKNFLHNFTCIIVENNKCICKINKCFELKSFHFDKYSSSKNIILKSVHSIFLSLYVYKINCLIKKNKPDLVINNYFFHVKSKNTIWVQHSSVEAYKGQLFKYKFLNWFSYLIKKISRTATPWKVANYIVNYTEYDEKNFKPNPKIFRKRFFIPLCIPEEDINYTFHSNANTKPFVFINRLAPQKKTSYLVDVACFLNKKYNKSIDVYGWGEEQDLVINKPGINYLGILNNDKTKEVLRNYKIFILTSDYEGFSYAVLEAMSQGTFVVARNTYPSLQYLLGNDRGFMINKNVCAEDFADKMIDCYGKNLDTNRRSSISFVLNNLTYNIFEKKWKEVISICTNELKS